MDILKKYGLAIVLVLIAGGYAQFLLITSEATQTLDHFTVMAEGLVFLMAAVGLFVVQNVNQQKRIYPYLTAGFALLSFGFLSDLLGEFVMISPALTLVFEEAFLAIGLILMVVGMVRWSSHSETSQEQLFHFATSDELTGLCNRRQFAAILATEVERAKRYGTPMSLISFNLDHFKTVNDRFGHAVGDELLKDVARLVGGLVRHSDTFARVGGDEFQILAPSTDLGDALGFADKLRSAIEDHRFTQAGFITASFGLAELNEDESVASLMQRVDKALFGSKEGGRNRLIAAP